MGFMINKRVLLSFLSLVIGLGGINVLEAIAQSNNEDKLAQISRNCKS